MANPDGNAAAKGKQPDEHNGEDQQLSGIPVDPALEATMAEGGNNEDVDPALTTEPPPDFDLDDSLVSLADEEPSTNDMDESIEVGNDEDEEGDEVQYVTTSPPTPLTVLPPDVPAVGANQDRLNLYARDQAIFQRFGVDFPGHAYTPIPTSGENLRCGLFALQRYIRGQTGDEPTMQTLLQLARNAADQAVLDIIGSADGADAQLLALLNNDTHFGVDQLDDIVQRYGQTVNIRMRLGYIGTDGQAHMLPGADLAVVDQVVWIQFSDDGIGHFSAIDAPGTFSAYDDYIAQYDETHLVFNFDKVATMIQSFFESQELPDCLKGTKVRPQDWSSNINQKNAAIEFSSKYSELGYSLNRTQGETKNADNSTPDDKKLLRGYSRVERQITGGKTYKKVPEKLWIPKLRKAPLYSEWLEKQPQAPASTSDSSGRNEKYVPFSKGTYTTPRRLNDHKSRRSLTLVDMVLACCPEKSSARDVALVSTGAEVGKLLESGLLTDEGVAKLKKLMAQAQQAKGALQKDRKKSTGRTSTSAAATPLTFGVRPAGLKSDFCRAFADLQLDTAGIQLWLRATADLPSTKAKKATPARSKSLSAKSKSQSASNPTPRSQTQASPTANQRTPTTRSQAQASSAGSQRTPTGSRGQTAAASSQADRRDPPQPKTPDRGAQTPTPGHDQTQTPSAQRSIRDFMQSNTPTTAGRRASTGVTRTTSERDSSGGSPEQQSRQRRRLGQDASMSSASTRLIAPALNPTDSHLLHAVRDNAPDHMGATSNILTGAMSHANESGDRASYDQYRRNYRDLFGRDSQVLFDHDQHHGSTDADEGGPVVEGERDVDGENGDEIGEHGGEGAEHEEHDEDGGNDEQKRGENDHGSGAAEAEV